jgi:hypothetical protein
MQSKSIPALKPFNYVHFLDSYFHRMDDTASKKNLWERTPFLAFGAL